MIRNPVAVLMLVAAGCAPMAAGAEEGAMHGYGGGGLALVSSNSSSDALGDTNWTGAGLGFTGAGAFDVGSIGIGVTGGMQFGSQTEQDTDAELTDAIVHFDGGVILVDMLYLSLGVNSYATTYDTGVGDITVTRAVIPLGIGFITADDKGYFLGQLRFGGGTASEDYSDTDEDIGYFGLRLQGQAGAENGVQFMGAMEMDFYDYPDSSDNFSEAFFRVILGVGFGT
jgi:hypothetical protein